MSLIDERSQQFHQAGMDAGMGLHEAVEPGHQHGLSQQRTHQVAHAGTMAADQVVLKLDAVLVAYLVLGHRAKTGIDPINQFSRWKNLSGTDSWPPLFPLPP